MSVEARFDRVLEVMAAHEVEFLVAGGVAAILHGSPLTTDDVNLVFQTSEDNVRRLSEALVELEATYVDPAGRRICPTLERLQTLDLHLLNTNCGRVDLLRRIGADLDYEDLCSRTRTFHVGDTQVAVLHLDAIIESKEHADRPKDHFQLPYLRQLRAELRADDDTTEGEGGS